MARNLAARAAEEEQMDAPTLGQAEMSACLADLARANTWTLGRRPTLGWLQRMTRSWRDGRALTILDVGAGQGDMLRAIAHWTERRGFWARLIGYDLNPRCVAAARAATPAALGIEYRTGDAAAVDVPVDFIVSSLVTHHMADDEIVAFLAWMERTARRGWFVNDLHRHRIAYHGFALLAAVMRWHPIVRHDGPLSVARGFRKPEWAALLARAGVPGGPRGARVIWHFPFRLCVERAR